MKEDNNSLLIIVIVLLLLLVLTSGFGTMGLGGIGGMMNMMYGGFGSGMMIFGWIFSILILVTLILLIFWLVKQIQKK